MAEFRNFPIPEGKLQDFDTLLKGCDGRYLANPRKQIDEHGHYRVDFGFYDEAENNINRFRWEWKKITEPPEPEIETITVGQLIKQTILAIFKK